jgi:hypothetical protein
VRGGIAPIDLGKDHRLYTCRLDLFTDGIGVVAAICAERFDPVFDHAEQRGKALHIVRLPGRQHEAEREPSG